MPLFLLFCRYLGSSFSKDLGLSSFNKVSIDNFLFSQKCGENHLLYVQSIISTPFWRKISQCYWAFWYKFHLDIIWWCFLNLNESINKSTRQFFSFIFKLSLDADRLNINTSSEEYWGFSFSSSFSWVFDSFFGRNFNLANFGQNNFEFVMLNTAFCYLVIQSICPNEKSLWFLF